MEASIIQRGFQDLPYEIIFNILSWLPAISLIKLKCVCKLWCAIIKSRGFIDMQLNRAIQKPTYLVQSPHDQNMYVMEEDANNAKITKIGVVHGYAQLEAIMWGTINGLLCYSTFPEYQSYHELIHLCNPITQEYKIFRKYDPTTAFAGFGFHPLNKEYKVVRFFYNSSDLMRGNRLAGEIHTLGTELWRSIESVPYQPAGDSVSVNGVIYWIIGDAFSSPHKYIVSFDLGDEQFRMISGPKIYSKSDSITGYLILLGEHLAFVDYQPHTEIWVLKDPLNVVWTKVFTLFHECPEDPIEVQGSWGNCRILTTGEVCKLGAYDLDGERFTSIGLPFGEKKTWVYWGMYDYCGTLVSPN